MRTYPFRLQRKHVVALLLLGLLSIIPRIVLWFYYEPTFFKDSSDYWGVALQFAHGEFSEYTAKRAIGYPLFITLHNADPNLIWVTQQLLGLLVTFCLYWLTFRLTRSVVWAFAVGFIQTASLAGMLFEAAMLTESLATALIVSGLVFFIASTDKDRPSGTTLIVSGLLISLAVITRPILMAVLPALILFLLYRTRGNPINIKIKDVARFASCPVLVIAGVSVFNFIFAGYLGPSSLLGYNLTNHSGANMEIAPEKFNDLKEIYLRYRYTTRSTHTMTMFIPGIEEEMLSTTGLTQGELSNRLAAMSLRVFIADPISYAQSVTWSWITFWTVPAYWLPENFRPASMAARVETILKGQKYIYSSLKIVFLVSVPFLLFVRFRYRVEQGIPDGLLLIVIVILSVSFAQALIESGENPRYSVPLSPVTYLVALVCLWFGPQPDNWRNREGIPP